jgi:hypothetical protein
MNQEVEQYLRIFTSKQQDDWVGHLHLSQFHINNTKSATTQVTPFFANYGYHPISQFLHPEGTATSPQGEDYVNKLKESWKDIESSMRLAQEEQARHYDRAHAPTPFKVGDKVLLSTRNLSSTLRKKKLGPRFTGPFEITHQIGNNAFRLKLPKGSRIHNVFHASLLKPYEQADFTRPAVPPPEPIELDGETLYQVEEIVQAKRKKGQVLFEAKWQGYENSRNTWEPLESFATSKGLVRDFYERRPKQPKPKNLQEFLSTPDEEEDLGNQSSEEEN